LQATRNQLKVAASIGYKLHDILRDEGEYARKLDEAG
jgi:hypothetical protein